MNTIFKKASKNEEEEEDIGIGEDEEEMDSESDSNDLEGVVLSTEAALEYKEAERLKVQLLKQLAQSLKNGEPLPNVPFHYFKVVFKEYRYLQKSRIAMHLRILSMKRTGRADTFILLPAFTYLLRAERQMENLIRRIVSGHPLWEAWGQHVGSFSPLALAWFIYYVRIEKVRYPSSLTRYCGYGVEEGGWGDRLHKGVKATYNPKLKTRVYVTAISFLKRKHPRFYPMYVAAKEEYNKKYPVQEIVDGKKLYSKAHIHMMSLRRMIKPFLYDLYDAWRAVEHLEINPNYIQAIYDYRNSHFNEPIPDVFDPIAQRKRGIIADPISAKIGDQAIRDLEAGEGAEEDKLHDAK